MVRHTRDERRDTRCERRSTLLLNRSHPATLALLLSVLLTGCVEPTKPDELFQLSPESNQNRAMQTRMFETSDENELLSASAAALQDLGFQVEESVREVGFLRAAKERSAREYGQYIQRLVFFVLSLGRWMGPVDLHQKSLPRWSRVRSTKRDRDGKCGSYFIGWCGKAKGRQSKTIFPPANRKWK